MAVTVASLLENFSYRDRDAGRQLAVLREEDPVTFQRSVVRYMSNGGQLPGTRLLIWLLQKEEKLLDLLLNPQLSSLEDAIKVSKLMKLAVDQLDVLLARALQEAHEELALRILRLLAEVAESNRTLPMLTRTLRETRPGLRSKAALVFSRHCHNTLFVENALKDPDPEVRASAIQGLGESEYQPDSSILAEAFTDSDPAVRAQAALACYRMGATDQAVEMVRTMSGHQDPSFRAPAAWAMGEIGDRPCVLLLEKLRDDPDPKVRAQAGEALSKLSENPSANGLAAGGAESGELEMNPIFASVDESGQRRVYVAVFDEKGEPVTDLAEEHFHIEEAGAEITRFHLESPSQRDLLSLAFVLDCSASMSIGKVREMNTAVTKCIDDKQPEDRLSIYKYAFDVERVVGYTESPKRLEAVIKRPYMGLKTASRLHDAIVQALDDLIPETGFRAVIAIADGTDRGSEHTYPAVVRRFRGALIPLYVIGYGCGKAERDLGSLGTQSGGLFLSADNNWELNDACPSLLRRLSNCYSISYEREEKPDGPLRLWIDGPSGAVELSVEPVVA